MQEQTIPAFFYVLIFELSYFYFYILYMNKYIVSRYYNVEE